MSHRLVAPAGAWIDRSRPLSFTFNGRAFSGFTGDTLASALLANGVRLLGRSFKLLAKPAADQLFNGWSGGITSEPPALTFVMTPNLMLTATFVANPFLDRSGLYVGLVQSTPATHEAGGLFVVTVAKTGQCTGKLILGGKPRPFKTVLKPNGTSPTITLPQPVGDPLVFSFSLDVVGISNLATFLKNTESYRRDLRRVEYGDERDPKMAEFMEKIAALNNAKKITKPMFVVAGANDPRVPKSEADQIVATLKQQSTPIWYLVGKDEGHGFQKKKNQDFQFYATVQFIRDYLLK